MNLAQRLAFVIVSGYNCINPKERIKQMKPISKQEAKSYIPVIMGELARCDASIQIICEDIAENGISLDNWIVLKHYIKERNAFANILEG